MTVGIVGAGITGLSLAHYLEQAGVEYVVLEASGEPGGVIESRRVDGRVVEWGPQRLRRTDPVDDLISDLGLEEEVITAGETVMFVYAEGRLRRAPFSVEEFMETDLLSAAGKRAVLAEPWTEPGRPDETAAELFTRKFGEEAYRNLLGPLFGGIYGSNPERMPARHALSGLLRLESKYDSLLKAALARVMSRSGTTGKPAISFLDGVQRLPEALYEAHAENVRLGTPVRAVAADERGDGYALETDGGTVAVDDVVVTTPADVTAELVADLAPESAAALAELTYNPLAMVYLRADCDREGFGCQVRHDEGLDTLGLSWNDSMFGDAGDGSDSTGREGVYTAFLGGMKNPELVGESDEVLGEIAVEEFAEITGCDAEVLDIARHERGFPAYDGSWDAVDDVAMPDGVHLATNYTARMGVPSRIREAERLSERLAAT